jgi:cation diffusion facilitator family transporter
MINEPRRRAKRVVWIGFVANLILTVAKILAGIFARSSAMIADGVHSVSDFATDLVVVSSLSVAQRPQDHNHKYGHGKVETLATAFVGGVLLLVGAGLFYSGVLKIYAVFMGEKLPQPGILALYAAAASIIIKELLYQYTIKAGKEVKSQALIANAWHHRSDAFSSIGTLAGIAGAIFLGEKWVFLDPLAAVIVSLFIFRVSIFIVRDALFELIETSLPKEHELEIMNIAAAVKGVFEPHDLKTRKIGNQIAIDIHIRVHKDLNVEQAHDITIELEDTLRAKYGEDTFISVHIEPLYTQQDEIH